MILIGWAVMAAVALVSMLIAGHVVINGCHPCEAMVVGIVLGAIARNAGLFPEKWQPYLKKFETPLLCGIVLLGTGFSVKVAAELPLSLVVIFSTMAVGFFFTYLVARKIGLPDGLSVLLAVGTTICGGSAIAITAPLIKAREEETSYAVSTITIAAFILLLTLPVLGRSLGLSETMFGVWAGTSVHNTPQTIGTGFIFGERAGQVTTMVKLTRNMFMILVALLVSVWHGARQSAENRPGLSAVLKAFPWFLFGYIGTAVCAVNGFFTPAGISFFKSAASFLILMGMVGIGFGTDFRHVRQLGVKPLLMGILGALVVTVTSLVLVETLGFQ